MEDCADDLAGQQCPGPALALSVLVLSVLVRNSVAPVTPVTLWVRPDVLCKCKDTQEQNRYDGYTYEPAGGSKSVGESNNKETDSGHKVVHDSIHLAGQTRGQDVL